MSQNQQHVFRAIADPTRREILSLLAGEDLTIAQLVCRFDVTRGAIKKHLIILEEGELISVHPRGRERVNRLEPAGLRHVADWVAGFSRFWDRHLDQLKQAVEAAEGEQENE